MVRQPEDVDRDERIAKVLGERGYRLVHSCVSAAACGSGTLESAIRSSSSGTILKP